MYPERSTLTGIMHESCESLATSTTVGDCEDEPLSAAPAEGGPVGKVAVDEITLPTDPAELADFLLNTVKTQEFDDIEPILEICRKHPWFQDFQQYMRKQEGLDQDEWTFGSAEGDPLCDLEDFCDYCTKKQVYETAMGAKPVNEPEQGVPDAEAVEGITSTAIDKPSMLALADKEDENEKHDKGGSDQKQNDIEIMQKETKEDDQNNFEIETVTVTVPMKKQQSMNKMSSFKLRVAQSLQRKKLEKKKSSKSSKSAKNMSESRSKSSSATGKRKSSCETAADATQTTPVDVKTVQAAVDTTETTPADMNTVEAAVDATETTPAEVETTPVMAFNEMQKGDMEVNQKDKAKKNNTEEDENGTLEVKAAKIRSSAKQPKENEKVSKGSKTARTKADALKESQLTKTKAKAKAKTQTKAKSHATETETDPKSKGKTKEKNANTSKAKAKGKPKDAKNAQSPVSTKRRKARFLFSNFPVFAFAFSDLINEFSSHYASGIRMITIHWIQKR